MKGGVQVNRVKRLVWKVLFLLFGLSLWELIVHLELFNELFMPSLFDIFEVLISDTLSGDLLLRSGISIALVLAALAVGTLLSLLLSALSHYSQVMRIGISMLTSACHPLPGIALLPLVILWFGTGSLSIFLVVLHSVLWPMTVSLSAGFSSVNPTYLDIGKNYELSRPGILFRILIPASRSYLVAGVKIGWARAWRAVISSEMVFGVMGMYGGLGWYLFESRMFMDSRRMYAGLIMLICIGLVVEQGLLRHVDDGPRRGGTV